MIRQTRGAPSGRLKAAFCELTVAGTIGKGPDQGLSASVANSRGSSTVTRSSSPLALSAAGAKRQADGPSDSKRPSKRSRQTAGQKDGAEHSRQTSNLD